MPPLAESDVFYLIFHDIPAPPPVFLSYQTEICTQYDRNATDVSYMILGVFKYHVSTRERVVGLSRNAWFPSYVLKSKQNNVIKAQTN